MPDTKTQARCRQARRPFARQAFTGLGLNSSYLVPLLRQLSNPSPGLERLLDADGKRTLDP